MDRIEVREQLSSHLLDMAEADPRVVAGAVVGSLVEGPGDRWSDLDLTFAVADPATMEAVLKEWTQDLVDNFDAIQALDLWRGETVYRVFFLPECVQLDLSLTPSGTVAAASPRFKLLFGGSHEIKAAPAAPTESFGYALMFAWSARVCLERDKPWMAEYCVSAARNAALEMACVRLGLPAQYGKGLDRLPREVTADFEPALVTSLNKAELWRALRAVIAAIARETDRHTEISPSARARLDDILIAS